MIIGNILIVDDSPIDRKVIRHILEKKLHGINIYEAEDGANIKDRLRVNKIHMCILDIVMPGKDGFQILKDLKEDPGLMDIPVIVCTGLEGKQAIEKALDLGAYDYFSKPLSEETIKISLPLKVKNAIELMKRKEEIIYLSYHDKLTGLYNRRFFEEEIKRLDIERNLPVSIIMGDVNGLKLVNDAFGHNKGDELIQKAAAAIKSSCRRDEIAARWGGDEFVVLLPKTGRCQAERIIERIKIQCSKEYVNSLRVSVSFGMATKNKADEDIETVLKKAEDNMYRQKIIKSQGARSSTINTIINTLHEKSPREEKHSKRVSEICEKIGKAMGFSEMEVNRLRDVGLLHDIGKIAVSEDILNKPEKLTEKEWEEIKKYPDIGYRILGTSYDLLDFAECVQAHHERWDGTGYPKGLKGDKIPVAARIISIADSFDAMTSEQSYRKAMNEEEACVEIRKNSGTQFDPEIARVFIEKVLDRRWN